MPHLKFRSVRFLDDTRGNFAILLGILVLPLVLVINFAVEYQQASTMRVNLQALADSVAIAAVNELPDTKQASDVAEYTYNAGVAELRAGLLFDEMKLVAEVTPDFMTHVTLSGKFKSASGMTFDLGNLEYRIEAKASIPLKRLEVAVAADATYSMRGTKISTLKNALNDFTKTILDSNSDTADVRVAMVPFSRAVTLPDYASDWFSTANTTDTGGKLCATRREGKYDSSDLSPDELGLDGYHEVTRGCTPYAMLPLSKDQDDLSTAINALTAYGYGTANQVAAEWLYRALSPNWATFWESTAAPNEYGQASKVAVLMTDGENEYYDRTHDDEGDVALLATCKAMKNDGIEVYAVTFKTPPSLRSIYQKCVSRPDNLLEAKNDRQLLDAFEKIAEEATRTFIKITN